MCSASRKNAINPLIIAAAAATAKPPIINIKRNVISRKPKQIIIYNTNTQLNLKHNNQIENNKILEILHCRYFVRNRGNEIFAPTDVPHPNVVPSQSEKGWGVLQRRRMLLQ
jgi:hypothetical protein